MTVGTEDPREMGLAGDGVNRDFPFNFAWTGEANFNILIQRQDGTLDFLENTTEFLATLDPDPNNGGILTLEPSVAVPEVGDLVNIFRSTPIEQLTVFYENGRLPAKNIENAFDLLTKIAQENTLDQQNAYTKLGIRNTLQNAGVNLGGGVEVLQGLDTAGESLQFHTLKGSSGVEVELVQPDPDPSTHYISVFLPDGLFYDSVQVSGNITKTITGTNQITLSTDAQNNILTDVGTGEGLSGGKSGDALLLKSIVAGDSIEVIDTGTELIVNATGSAAGEANSLVSEGDGTSLVGSKAGVNLGVKSLSASVGVRVLDAGTKLEVQGVPSTESAAGVIRTATKAEVAAGTGLAAVTAESLADHLFEYHYDASEIDSSFYSKSQIDTELAKKLTASASLSDVASAFDARNNIDVYSKTEVDARATYALIDAGTVSSSSRYVVPNPFGNDTPVICVAHLFLNGTWGASGWIYVSGSGSYGTLGHFSEGEGLVVKTGSAGVSHFADNAGGSTAGGITASAPCRLLVWRVGDV